MSVRSKSILILCLIPVLADAAGAGTTGSGVEIWRTIETDMRQEGCFKPPIATVHDALRSTETLCRFRAVRVLGLRGEKAAVPDLKALHESDPDPGVRSQAAVELVRLGERAYLDAAREAMEQSPTLSGKVSLAGQLATVGDASGFRHVEEACRAEDSLTRQGCLSVLGLFRGPAEQDERLRAAILDQMVDLAEDPDAGVRQSAAYGLSAYGSEMVLPAAVVARLEEIAATSEDPKVKETARTTVENQKRKKKHDFKAQ